MEDSLLPASGVSRSPRKFLKRAIPKVIPDPAKTVVVLRALQTAAETGLDPEMLAINLASLGYDDETLHAIQTIYIEYQKQTAL